MAAFTTLRAEPSAKPAPGSVQVVFLPPPVEPAIYSVGIYDAKTGRLVRRLHEHAEEGAFAAGLNGFITSWDRRDDAGKTVPAGKYAARGWAVGEMKVEGEAILGNDWAGEDEITRITRVRAMDYVPADDGIVLLTETVDRSSELLRISGREGSVLWRRKVTTSPFLLAVVDSDNLVHCGEGGVCYNLVDGRQLPAPPRKHLCDSRLASYWWTTRHGVFEVLEADLIAAFRLPDGEQNTEIEKRAVRSLLTEPGQPRPVFVAFGSPEQRRLYLLEESPGWQRVRGLEYSETKPDADGRPVSEWRTFFERNIRRPDPALGLDETAPSPVVELPLPPNPLEPGKPQRAKLRAGFDGKGAFLETADGLRLLPISERPHLRAVHLKRDPQEPGRLLFYQFDGAAWDVFSVSGAPKALMGFDAGEFELTADGERRPEPPADGPHDF